MGKATLSTGQENLLAGSLSLQSSETQQGKLSGDLNCQTMLHPNTEVVPVTTFALSYTESFHVPVVISFSLLTRYSQRRENINLGLKHWAQVSLLCMQQVNPSLPQYPLQDPSLTGPCPLFLGRWEKKISSAEGCVGISPHAS